MTYESLETIAPGVYVQTADVANPKPNRAKLPRGTAPSKHDRPHMVVWPKGTRWLVTVVNPEQLMREYGWTDDDIKDAGLRLPRRRVFLSAPGCYRQISSLDGNPHDAEKVAAVLPTLIHAANDAHAVLTRCDALDWSPLSIAEAVMKYAGVTAESLENALKARGERGDS